MAPCERLAEAARGQIGRSGRVFAAAANKSRVALRLNEATALAIVSASLLSHPQGAKSQTVDYDRGQNQGVLDRAATDYGPDGLPVGGLRLYPAMTLQGFYDSNIYASQFDRQDDFISVIQPQARLVSDTGRDQFALYGQDSLIRYASHSTEDSNAWTLGGSGQIDVLRDWSFQARVEHQSAVEPRTDPSTPIAAAEPTIYDLQLESLQVVKTFNRLRLTGSAEDDTVSYGVVTLNGGSSVNEDYRNNSHYLYGGLLQLALSPAFSVYSKVSYNVFDYTRFFPDQALSYAVGPNGQFTSSPTFVALPHNLNQNSDGYTADVGADFDISHLIRGSAAVGYLSQNAHDPRLPDYAGPHGQAQVDYFLTPLITLHVSTSRSVNASGLTGSPAFLSTDVRGAAEYGFRRNIVFSVSAAGGWDDYKGIDRNDTRQSYSASGTYYIGRHFSVVGRYSRISLDSHGAGAGQSYAVDQVGFSIVYAR